MKKTVAEMNEICGKVDKALTDNHVWVDWIGFNTDWFLPVIEVTVKGDWKHDHWRSKVVMEEQFPEFTYLGETVTEEDGGDWYTAIHKYAVVK